MCCLHIEENNASANSIITDVTLYDWLLFSNLCRKFTNKVRTNLHDLKYFLSKTNIQMLVDYTNFILISKIVFWSCVTDITLKYINIFIAFIEMWKLSKLSN